MIKYTLKQYKNSRSSIFRKWLAYPVIEETLDLNALAKHMASHSSPYSEGVVRGVLTDMVKCIKEQLLEGKNVKIDNLAIFSVGIKNSKGGATSEEEFNLTKNISSVKLRAREREAPRPRHWRAHRQEPEPGGYAQACLCHHRLGCNLTQPHHGW